MKGPKVRWMELKKYETKYGKADHSAYRSHMVDGKLVTGVDYVKPEDTQLSSNKFGYVYKSYVDRLRLRS